MNNQKIYYVRHGESESNEQNLVSGSRLDVALTTKGKDQAHEFAKTNLSLLKQVDHVFVSPLIRAQETAKIIFSDFDVPIETVDDLREIYAGIATGQPHDADFNDKMFSNQIPDAEKYEDFTKRVIKAFDYVASHDAQTPMIVAHGWVWQAMSKAKGNLDALDPPNCSLCEISRDLFV